MDGLKEIAQTNLNIFILDCLCCPMIMFDLSKAPKVKELKYFVNSRGLQQVFTRNSIIDHIAIYWMENTLKTDVISIYYSMLKQM